MTKISFEIPDRDDRGVSPVIGVILMVAITVILAAVIASFVLGFGDSVSENVQAGADVSERDNGDVRVTWISEGNAVQLNVTHDSDDVEPSDTIEVESVGDSAKIYLDGSPGDSEDITVTVTAVGSGDSKTVITQEDVTVADNGTSP